MGLAAFTQDKVGEFVAAAALLSPITYLNHINSAFLNVAAHYYIEKVPFVHCVCLLLVTVNLRYMFVGFLSSSW